MRISDWSADVCSADLVEEVGGSAGVELIGPVQTHAALVEQVGQHPVDNRRAKLRLDVVADDRNACLGETLRPYRIAGDEDGDVVHECDASLQRAFRVKLGRFLASDRQIVHQELGPAFPSSEEHTSELQSLLRIS